MTKNTRQTGNLGESLAENYLRNLKYKIIRKNVRSPFGEIDLVTEDKNTLVFVEVKTRTNLAYGHPFEAVTQTKKIRLIRLGEWYLAKHRITKKTVRFDVLAITLSEPPCFELVQNAIES